jgi:hypothetical protein
MSHLPDNLKSNSKPHNTVIKNSSSKKHKKRFLPKAQGIELSQQSSKSRLNKNQVFILTKF